MDNEMKISKYELPIIFDPSNLEKEIESWVKDSNLSELIAWLAAVLMPSELTESAILLRDIQTYLESPSSNLRWNIFKKSEEVGFSTTSGLLGLALFLLKGSMSPDEYEPVYPPDGVVEQIIGCILMLLIVSKSQAPSNEAEKLYIAWCNYKLQ
ncbi:TPA: hypothetical protein N6814_004533 [Escherichia coli]|nr:hypothetical protein [Escherichia coli]HCN7760873.1 hypothetical protein [Escherichia coli]HCN9483143.1 hypothetical protein [Escherichia coli]